jgi:uncharacterized protein with GYD domain
MPYFMHQWKYKDKQVAAMVARPQDRARIVRLAAKSFGGKVLQFFFAFGEYDGVAITKFDSNEEAFACFLHVFSDGELESIKTTVLLHESEGMKAMRDAHSALEPAA